METRPASKRGRLRSRWLIRSESTFKVANLVEEHAPVAEGVEALTTDHGNGELTVWIEPIRTVVAADVLIGAESERTEALRVCPQAWLDGQSTVERVKAALRPLLERDVEAIVPLHGAPVLSGAAETLRRALEKTTAE